MVPQRFHAAPRRALPPHFADPATIISNFADLVTTFTPVLWQMSHHRVSKVAEHGHRAGKVRSPGRQPAGRGALRRHRPIMRVHNPTLPDSTSVNPNRFALGGRAGSARARGRVA